jgi:hypothetical protein
MHIVHSQAKSRLLLRLICLSSRPSLLSFCWLLYSVAAQPHIHLLSSYCVLGPGLRTWGDVKKHELCFLLSNTHCQQDWGGANPFTGNHNTGQTAESWDRDAKWGREGIKRHKALMKESRMGSRIRVEALDPAIPGAFSSCHYHY